MEEKRKHAGTIIKSHVIWSMGAGLIPIMAADVLAITALQIDMIRQLSKVFDVDFKETRGKAVVSSLTTATLTRMGARSVVKMIPVLGSFIGGAALSIFAGASTYALGQVFIRHFETGGTILDFDPDSVKNFYNEQFEKGKEYAREWRSKTRKETTEDINNGNGEDIIDLDEIFQPEPTKTKGFDISEEISKISKLKDEGLLTEEEFSELKKKIIEKYSAL